MMAKVAQLDRRGYPQAQIAKMVGVSYITVMNYLRKMRERSKEIQLGDREELVKEKLQQYREVMMEAWEGYSKSMKDAESITEEEYLGGKPDEDGEVQARGKIVRKTEGRLPGTQYLKVIQDCLAAERELLGMDAPKKMDVKAQVISIDWTQLFQRPDLVILEATDPIEAKILEAEQAAKKVAELPKANGQQQHTSHDNGDDDGAENNGNGNGKSD